jgi:PhnB protein
MVTAVKPIPAGHHSITPHLVVRDVAEAIAFYQKAFGAVENNRLPGPDGKSVMHGELKIGDSIIFLGAESPGAECKSPATLKGTAVMFYLYVEDADAAYRQAVAAGAKALMPVQEWFWGDRMGSIEDPFGHRWSVATRIKDLSPEEIAKEACEFFSAKGENKV